MNSHDLEIYKQQEHLRFQIEWALQNESDTIKPYSDNYDASIKKHGRQRLDAKYTSRWDKYKRLDNQDLKDGDRIFVSVPDSPWVWCDIHENNFLKKGKVLKVYEDEEFGGMICDVLLNDGTELFHMSFDMFSKEKYEPVSQSM